MLPAAGIRRTVQRAMVKGTDEGKDATVERTAARPYLLILELCSLAVFVSSWFISPQELAAWSGLLYG